MADIQCNPKLTDDLTDRLEQIWADVTDAGGAVGFAAPADLTEIRTGAAAMWDDVLDGVLDLLVATDAGAVVGFAFLRPGPSPVERHRATVLKLQRHPATAGRGIGSALLAAVEDRAASRGVEVLALEVRAGEGLEAWYARHGYRAVATLPGWVRIDDDRRDLVVMQKDLAGPQDPAAPIPDDPAADDPAPGGTTVDLLITRLDPDLPLPRYANPGDAGLDLHAREDATLPAGTRRTVPTGIAVAIPDGFVGLVHPRSGTAVRQGLSIVNAPGTIDAGYRGELLVPLINHDPSATVRIRRGDRIAQLLLQRVERARLVEVDDLPDGVRGTGGFGSTGT